MARRTHIEDVREVLAADDLDEVVRDKRRSGRAHKRSARRNRHYQRALLRHIVGEHEADDDEPR
ncbi:MAG: hypothetical protein AAGA54_34775 [Myxococcota bacterium]